MFIFDLEPQFLSFFSIYVVTQRNFKVKRHEIVGNKFFQIVQFCFYNYYFTRLTRLKCLNFMHMNEWLYFDFTHLFLLRIKLTTF